MLRIANPALHSDNFLVLFFAAPMFLLAVPLVAAAGLWVLFQSGRHRLPVSSTKLWRGLSAAVGSEHRRRVDPAWFLVFLAALLAAVALACPVWRSGPSLPANPPAADVYWALRTEPHSDHLQLFLQLTSPRNLPATLGIKYDPGDSSSGISISTADALRGIILTPPFSPGARHTLRLHASAGQTDVTLATTTFTPPAAPSFALLTLSNTEHPPDPSLQRVFTIQPGVRTDNPSGLPAVILDSLPFSRPEEFPPNTLVITLPSPSAPPGLSLQPKITIPPTQPLSAGLPGFITFDHVHVHAFVPATASPDWQILATIQSHPWIALHKSTAGASGPTICWLASVPSTDTDWPQDPSFVLFFSNLLTQFLHASPKPLDWTSSPAAISHPHEPALHSLSPWLGAAVVLALLGAMLLLHRRTLPVSAKTERSDSIKEA